MGQESYNSMILFDLSYKENQNLNHLLHLWLKIELKRERRWVFMEIG